MHTNFCYWQVRTDRLLTLLPLPPDCVAFEDLPANENPKPMLMELLGSLHHPYIYPILDLGFFQLGSSNFACLVTPFNSRGSLKDLIYRVNHTQIPCNTLLRRDMYTHIYEYSVVMCSDICGLYIRMYAKMALVSSVLRLF